MSERLFADVELFAVPEAGGSTLVYAPLRRVVLRLAATQVNLLARARQGTATAADLGSDLVTALKRAGLGAGAEPPPPHCTAALGEYCPSRLTLFLTTACNLRCVYCYADKAHTAVTMPVGLGEAAIHHVFRYAEQAGRKRVEIGFHGGGEPTRAWDELTALAACARRLEAERGVECRLSLATNGCLTRRQADWIGRNFQSVNLSLDGAPRLHDRQRPRADGGPSSPALRRTMRALEAAKCPYACQATVLQETSASMPETVRYVSRCTKARELKFEPVMPDGRFRGREADVPGAEAFADHFATAYAIGLRRGVNVMFSALRFAGPPLSCFCGAFDTPFGVTPDGYVSACFETFVADGEFGDAFLIGRYDPKDGRFVIDHARLAALRRRHVANMATCRDCFCKYACAGDCASRNFSHFGRPDLFAVGARCELIRAVAKRHLQYFLDTAAPHGVCRIPETGEARHES